MENSTGKREREKKLSACCPSLGLCAATCPLKVTVKDGRITHIANHPDYLCCIQGHSQRSSVYDPKPLKYPDEAGWETRGRASSSASPGTKPLTSTPGRSKRSAASTATSPSCFIRRAAPWAWPGWRRRYDSPMCWAEWRQFGARCALLNKTSVAPMMYGTAEHRKRLRHHQGFEARDYLGLRLCRQ